MASILKPFGNHLNPSRVPLGPVTVDWTNPLSQRLIGCWLPGISYGRNLGSVPMLDLTPGSAVTTANTPDGPGLKVTAANQQLQGNCSWTNSPYNQWSQSTNINQFSLFCRMYTLGNSSNNLLAVGVTTDTAGSSPFHVASIATVSATTKIQLAWNSSGLHTSSVQYDPGANVMTSLGGSFTVGGNAILYGEGLQKSSDSFGATTPSSSDSTVNIGNYVSLQSDFINSIVTIACMWNRALTADEQVSMALSPYQFLIPAEYEMPAVFVAATTVNWGFQPWDSSSDQIGLQQVTAVPYR
jgi:hypothetical protein